MVINSEQSIKPFPLRGSVACSTTANQRVALVQGSREHCAVHWSTVSSFPTEFLFRQHLHFYSLLFSCVLGKAKISSEIQTSIVSCLDLSSCVLLSFLVPTLPALMTTLHSNGANIILDVFNPGSSVHRWKVTSLSSSICFWQTDKGAFYHNFTAEVSAAAASNKRP